MNARSHIPLGSVARRCALVALVASSTLGAAGCGDDGTSGSTEGSGGGASGSAAPTREELEAYVQAEREATCAIFTGCCTAAERVYATPLRVLLLAGPEADTLEGCLAFYESFVPASSVVGFLEDQLASGRATWDASKVEPCLAAWSNCAIPRTLRAGIWGDGCADPPVVPARKLGEACESFADCIDGTCEAGACVALPAVGAACGDVNGQPLACGEGASCDSLESTCAALLAVGEACAGSAACATGECHAKPFETGVCVEPSICDGDTTNDPGLVLSTCSLSDPDRGSVACELGTSSLWRCACTDAMGNGTTCELPFDRAQQQLPEGACTNLGCCAN